MIMPAHYQTRRRAAIARRLANEGAWAIVRRATERGFDREIGATKQ
jgi:hypothetical protein